jgi:RHS repeat-associated protein
MRLGAVFSYDHVGQLTGAEYEEPELRAHRYSYDEVQNLVSKEVLDPQGEVERATRYFFDEGAHPSPQRVARVRVGTTDTSLSYDAVGQLRGLDGAAFEYDVLGNLAAATLPGGTRVEHHFDAVGERRITVVRDAEGKVQKSERLFSDDFSLRDGEKVWQVSSTLDRAELKSSPGLQVDLALLDELRQYVRNGGQSAGLKQPVPDAYMDLNDDESADFDAADLAFAEAAGDARVGGRRVSVTYHHADHLGSATHVTTASGRLLSQQVFLAYGELGSRSGEEPLHGFTGMRRDLFDLGLVHMGAREYSPTLGRWLTPDRYIGESPRLMVDKILEANLYAYARGNPVRFLDPSGRGAAEKIVEQTSKLVLEKLATGVAANSNAEIAVALGFRLAVPLMVVYEISKYLLTPAPTGEVEGSLGYCIENPQARGCQAVLRDEAKKTGEAIDVEPPTGDEPTIGFAGGGDDGEPPSGSSDRTRPATAHGMPYHPRVRARAVQDPVSHNFPYSLDDAILATTPEIKDSGYKIYRLRGTMTGSVVTDSKGNRTQKHKEGVFEIGVTKDGVIDHRFFRPDK